MTTLGFRITGYVSIVFLIILGIGTFYLYSEAQGTFRRVMGIAFVLIFISVVYVINSLVVVI